jgi:hypothetical protein
MVTSKPISCTLAVSALLATTAMPPKHGFAAAPPIEASPGKSAAGAGGAGAVEPLSYEVIAPGLLARTLFATTATDPLGVAFVDILVGPGQITQLPAAGFAALVDIEAGNALLSVDGRSVTARPGTAIAVAQGQVIEIDNQREERPFLARLIELKALQK